MWRSPKKKLAKENISPPADFRHLTHLSADQSDNDVKDIFVTHSPTPPLPTRDGRPSLSIHLPHSPIMGREVAVDVPDGYEQPVRSDRLSVHPIAVDSRSPNQKKKPMRPPPPKYKPSTSTVGNGANGISRPPLSLDTPILVSEFDSQSGLAVNIRPTDDIYANVPESKEGLYQNYAPKGPKAPPPLPPKDKKWLKERKTEETIPEDEAPVIMRKQRENEVKEVEVPVQVPVKPLAPMRPPSKDLGIGRPMDLGFAGMLDMPIPLNTPPGTYTPIEPFMGRKWPAEKEEDKMAESSNRVSTISVGEAVSNTGRKGKFQKLSEQKVSRLKSLDLEKHPLEDEMDREGDAAEESDSEGDHSAEEDERDVENDEDSDGEEKPALPIAPPRTRKMMQNEAIQEELKAKLERRSRESRDERKEEEDGGYNQIRQIQQEQSIRSERGAHRREIEEIATELLGQQIEHPPTAHSSEEDAEEIPTLPSPGCPITPFPLPSPKKSRSGSSTVASSPQSLPTKSTKQRAPLPPGGTFPKNSPAMLPLPTMESPMRSPGSTWRGIDSKEKEVLTHLNTMLEEEDDLLSTADHEIQYPIHSLEGDTVYQIIPTGQKSEIVPPNDPIMNAVMDRVNLIPIRSIDILKTGEFPAGKLEDITVSEDYENPERRGESAERWSVIDNERTEIATREYVEKTEETTRGNEKEEIEREQTTRGDNTKEIDQKMTKNGKERERKLERSHPVRQKSEGSFNEYDIPRNTIIQYGTPNQSESTISITAIGDGWTKESEGKGKRESVEKRGTTEDRESMKKEATIQKRESMEKRESQTRGILKKRESEKSQKAPERPASSKEREAPQPPNSTKKKEAMKPEITVQREESTEKKSTEEDNKREVKKETNKATVRKEERRAKEEVKPVTTRKQESAEKRKEELRRRESGERRQPEAQQATAAKPRPVPKPRTSKPTLTPNSSATGLSANTTIMDEKKVSPDFDILSKEENLYELGEQVVFRF